MPLHFPRSLTSRVSCTFTCANTRRIIAAGLTNGKNKLPPAGLCQQPQATVLPFDMGDETLHNPQRKFLTDKNCNRGKLSIRPNARCGPAPSQRHVCGTFTVSIHTEGRPSLELESRTPTSFWRCLRSATSRRRISAPVLARKWYATLCSKRYDIVKKGGCLSCGNYSGYCSLQVSRSCPVKQSRRLNHSRKEDARWRSN